MISNTLNIAVTWITSNYATFIAFIAFLAVLIVTHEFGHFITAKLFKLRVDEFAFGFPPKIFSKKIGETKYSLNAIPFGGFVKIYGESEEGADPSEDPKRSFYFQPAWKRSLVIVAGVVMNFLIGWMAFSVITFFIGIPQGVYVSGVIPQSPAELAGFVSGEKISGFTSISDFQAFVKTNAGKEITIDGKKVTPRINPPENEGALGIALDEGDFEKYNVLKSVGNGFTASIFFIGKIFAGLGGLLYGATHGENVLTTLTGPVGIAGVIGQATSKGILSLVTLLGVLSLNLAVFNLLPFPALDGGRLFFILIEKVIGKRLNVKYEAIANLIGFALLMLLAITVTVHDVYKLTL